MDTLRGTFDSGVPADDSQDWDAYSGAPADEKVRELPPEAIGQDERRMQVRAYNHWASLLGDANFPSIEDLEPESLSDFGPNSVLLDFSAGIDDPVVQFLGTRLGEECGTKGPISRLSDVPPRSLLSRITDHYMQILANQAPIGFEAEFVNQRGAAILYRGILLPYSSDDDTIDFILGVINWKEMADAATADELLLEIEQSIGTGSDEPAVEDEDEPHKHHADALTSWADSPAFEDEMDAGAIPDAHYPDAHHNVTAFAPDPWDASEPAGDDGLPQPDFGQFGLDDPEFDEYGEELDEEGEEEEDEDGGSYSFASLSDHMEPPAKKAIDLDADCFDPADYRVDVDLHDGAVPDAGPDAGPNAGPNAGDAFDLGGHEIEEGFVSAEYGTDDAEDIEDTDDVDAVVEAALAAALSEEGGLYDCLAAARELAQSARTSEDRSRQALYAAVGRAYDVSLAAEAEPEAYQELIEDAGLTAQDRAPMTPIVKLVFGHDYDKTRLTEYAAVLSHAHRLRLDKGTLADFLGSAEGGLKAVVGAERRLRREEAGKIVEPEGDMRAQLAKKLRALEQIMLESLDGDGPEFSLVMVRRDASGKAVLIGEIADDVALIERAGKRLVG